MDGAQDALGGGGTGTLFGGGLFGSGCDGTGDEESVRGVLQMGAGGDVVERFCAIEGAAILGGGQGVADGGQWAVQRLLGIEMLGERVETVFHFRNGGISMRDMYV